MERAKVIGLAPAAMDEDLLTWAASREVSRCPGTLIRLELGAVESLVLLGALQLCLRHPQMPATTRNKVRQFAEGIEKAVQTIGPAVAEVARRGWHDTL